MQAAEEAAPLHAPTRDAAVSALFAAEAPRLLAFAQVLTGDRSVAEELVQDAFVTLYRRWSWLRDPDAASSYLTAAVLKGTNLALRQRYAARKVDRRVRLERGSDAPSAESALLAGEQRRAVLDSLSRLPMRQRQVVLLRYYDDRSEQEIAEILNISRGAVKRHASRALASLTHVLEGSP